MLKTLIDANGEFGTKLVFYFLRIIDIIITILFQLMESLNERLYEHPNFVWLDQVSFEKNGQQNVQRFLTI